MDGVTVLTGADESALDFDQLAIDQRLYVGGTRQVDGSVLAARISLAPLADSEEFETTLDGHLSQITPATAAEPAASLILLTGRADPEMFRRRLKLTVEAFLEGAGTAPAILKMVAATMGWGSLEGTFTDWSADWAPTDPVFNATAESAPGPIRLRELPLRPVTTSIPHRVKTGARWLETNDSSFVVQPSIQYKALDMPVVMPTLISLAAQVVIKALVALETIKIEDDNVVEQDVTLRIEERLDGRLHGTLIERRLRENGVPTAGISETDVTDHIRVQTSGLRVDREGAVGFLHGGSEARAAALVISDGRRAIRLTARGEGIWGNAIQVAHAAPDQVSLRYDPALAVDELPSEEKDVYTEVLALDELLAGDSRLITARDFSFTIPGGESRWLYFDHMGWAMFDINQWDRTVFDEPPAGDEDLEELITNYPAKGIYDYGDFNATVFPQEFLRAFRFNQAGSVYDEAFFNETPEQVEVLLGWQEGQRATIRIDVPLATYRDRVRFPFLPEMIRKVKAAGIKVILAARFVETQPLGELPPSLHLRSSDTQPLSEHLPTLHLRTPETQLIDEQLPRIHLRSTEALPLDEANQNQAYHKDES